MWEASKNVTWDTIQRLAKVEPVILSTLVIDTISLFDPTGVSDITAGAINFAYFIALWADDKSSIWPALLGILQLGLGLLQAGIFLVSGGTAAPIIVLLRAIIRGSYHLLTKPAVWKSIINFIFEIIELIPDEKLKEIDQQCNRCSTWDEAEKMHNDAICLIGKILGLK